MLRAKSKKRFIRADWTKGEFFGGKASEICIFWEWMWEPAVLAP
jgi:hypothetical protein